MICDSDDVVGLCGLCSTLIHAGEEVKHDDIENPMHYRCLEKAAMEEMSRISQETGQYDRKGIDGAIQQREARYNHDFGGD